MSQQRSAAVPSGVKPYVIQSGDTLSQIALDRLKALGRSHSGPDIAKAVDELAHANGLSDPNRIRAGESLHLEVLGQVPSGFPRSPIVSSASAPQAQRWNPAPPSSRPAPFPSPAGRPQAVLSGVRHPVLERTLDRAVENEYIPRADRPIVREKIISMAQKYRFSPDDFATVALMESDGLNPKANNGRCFGIIQFCGGPQAGAAAVGLASQAERIVERPVIEQLDLVDRYFEHNGLQRLPQVGLVDLYLTVLTPAARREQGPAAPLPIPGTQARMLHENQDRSQPITRTSILSGLLDHARQMLAGLQSTSGNPSGKPGGKNLPLASTGAQGPGRRPG
jgi:hypothetical protein